MEKQLVQTYGISWADANRCLRQARQDLGDRSSDSEILQNVAAELAAATKVQHEQEAAAQVAQQQARQQVRQERSRQKGRYIVFKKTFKTKANSFSNEKSFSFHGKAVTPALMDAVNRDLAEQVRYTNGANKIAFAMSDVAGGFHYMAEMNHQCQKYHEEDILCCILETMEEHGYLFRFQYDASLSSDRVGTSSQTDKECFLFYRAPAQSNAMAPLVSAVVLA